MVKKATLLIFGITIIVTLLYPLFFRNINNNEEYFAYLGNPQSMRSLHILNKESRTFYVASGAVNDKTATFFISAKEIDKAIQNGEKITSGDDFVVELLPEWISDAQYKLRFRNNVVSSLIFSECQGKFEECYLEEMRNMVKKELDKNNPASITFDQITINKENFEIIEAKPKNKPNGAGCNPTYYEIIRYRDTWYTYRTSDICIE